MKPLGYFSTELDLEGVRTKTPIFVFSEVSGLLISWKRAKELRILSASYPNPPPMSTGETNVRSVSSSNVTMARQQLLAEFADVFSEEIKPMVGEMFKIRLTDDAVPFAVSTPRNVPYNYMEKLKTELDQLLKDGVIVPVTEPTDWCSPITVVPKTNDKIRMCVDLT